MTDKKKTEEEIEEIKRLATEQISEKTAAAAALLEECEEIAKMAEVTFQFQVDGAAIGGTFSTYKAGNGKTVGYWENDWQGSSC